MSWDSLPETIKVAIQKEYEGDLQDRRKHDNRIDFSELDLCIRRAYLRRRYPIVPDFDTIMRLWRGKLLHPALLRYFSKNEVSVRYPIVGTDIVLAGRIDAIDDDGTITELKTVATLFYLKQRAKPNPWDEERVLSYAYNWGAAKARIIYVDLGGSLTFELETEKAEKAFLKRVELAKVLHQALKDNEIPEPINCLKLDSGEYECTAFNCEYAGKLCSGVENNLVAKLEKSIEEVKWDI